MSVSRKKCWLLNANRMLIYSFSLLGLFYQQNWAYVIALTLWVWLPVCTKAELMLFNYYRPLHVPVVNKMTAYLPAGYKLLKIRK